MSTLIRAIHAQVPVRAHRGMWIVDCPRCPNAMLADQSPPIECRNCGTRFEAVWPSPEMIQGVERLLLMRPDPLTRNWYPEETLTQLVWENGLHGIFDNLENTIGLQIPGTCLLSVEEDRISTDALPVTGRETLREIT